MQEGCVAKVLPFGTGESKLFADIQRVLGDPLGVARGVAVLCLDGADEHPNSRVVGLAQLEEGGECLARDDRRDDQEGKSDRTERGVEHPHKGADEPKGEVVGDLRAHVGPDIARRLSVVEDNLDQDKARIEDAEHQHRSEKCGRRATDSREGAIGRRGRC